MRTTIATESTTQAALPSSGVHDARQQDRRQDPTERDADRGEGYHGTASRNEPLRERHVDDEGTHHQEADLPDQPAQGDELPQLLHL